ncbi:isocitrate lyase [Candidatus Bathyarchaeota archaeon]|nr:MAG: isocitrate lyase [Candidatus Bathyarchaeota archaeon]TMI59959.1 MAG: isocitrate lyase [Candidatus Bathyarchaeota archaeon]
MTNGTKHTSRESERLSQAWRSERWNGIRRPYSAEDVCKLRGTVHPEFTLARLGAEKFERLLRDEAYIPTLGALTGAQALQMVQAGLKAIYMSGWQVAADANLSGQTYPDQSLYPANSVPHLVKRINQAFQRADQIQFMNGQGKIDWFVPIIADAEAGFGGPLNAFELMKAMIEAGAAGVHFEDQLASEKKCGHLGGKVLVPTRQFIKTLIAARLASDVMGVPTYLIARTDAMGAKLLSNDGDPRDLPYITGERTTEGFYRIKSGLEAAIARAISYGPYADILWCETPTPDLDEARRFAEAVHRVYPGKLLAYNCSPSFNWEKNLDSEIIQLFQKELATMGYKFQFVTLAGFHSLSVSMFELAKQYAVEGMAAYVRVQRKEFEAEPAGYAAVKHQAFVGTEYFDEVANVISSGTSSTTAMGESTETVQFKQQETLAAPSGSKTKPERDRDL